MFHPADKVGPYTLISRIGRGAFGEVWLAEELTNVLTHRVALKLANDDEIGAASLRQEAHVWEQVKGHPNVLPIIRAEIFDGQLALASEYIPEGSLAKHLKSTKFGFLPAKEALHLISGILSGLHHLHRKGVIHRDLKPENILLQAGTPRIADFGIARLIESSSSSTVVTGTPSYMAPECFYGNRTTQTDIWAVGIILHQLLTGHLPFPQKDQVSVMNAILNSAPVIDSHLPDGLHRLIRKALERAPANRYDSASSMLHDLDSFRDTGALAPQFQSIVIDTQPDFEIENETVVLGRPSTLGGAAVGQQFNPWKGAVIAFGSMLVFAAVVGVLALSGIGRGDGNSKTANNRESTSANVAWQPIIPRTSSGNSNTETDPETSKSTQPHMAPGDTKGNTNTGGSDLRSMPGGDGYNPWAAATPLPLPALPKRYRPPGGQGYSIDPNSGSQFMPNESGIILVPLPANSSPEDATANAGKRKRPAANEDVPTEGAATEKPLAAPRKASKKGSECIFSGKC